MDLSISPPRVNDLGDDAWQAGRKRADEHQDLSYEASKLVLLADIQGVTE